MLVQQEQRVPAYVPKELEQEVISCYYNNPLHGHLGITQTIELIKRHYKFLNIKDKVSKFIKQCVSC
jgi:hypothetical protein